MKKTALIFFSRSTITEARSKSFGLSNPEIRRQLVSRMTRLVLGRLGRLDCDKFWFSDVPIHRRLLAASGFTANMLQSGTELRSRIQQAFVSLFGLGYDEVLVIGNDTWIPRRDLVKAIETPGDAYGPSADGGFYLLKLCRRSPNLRLLEPAKWNEGRLSTFAGQVFTLKTRVDFDHWKRLVSCPNRHLATWIRSITTAIVFISRSALLPSLSVDVQRMLPRPPPHPVFC